MYLSIDLIMTQMLNFFGNKKEGRELSNFYEGEILITDEDGFVRTYGSGEAAFHGMKYIEVSKVSEDQDRKSKLEEYGKKFERGEEFGELLSKDVKKKGGKGGLKLTEEEINKWNNKSFGIQKQICKYKFEHDDAVKLCLEKSKGKVLIHPACRCSDEKVKRAFWNGRGKIEDGRLVILGTNMLGRLWMELRED